MLTFLDSSYYFNCESVDLYYLLITFALFVVTDSDSNRLREFLYKKIAKRKSKFILHTVQDSIMIYN
jgi:hypothetical protein